MIQASKESIEDFKRIFKNEYGVEYSDAEAYEASYNLIGFFQLLLKVDERNKREEKYEKKR